MHGMNLILCILRMLENTFLLCMAQIMVYLLGMVGAYVVRDNCRKKEALGEHLDYCTDCSAEGFGFNP